MSGEIPKQAVWILGNGQLGAMLRHAGMPLGIDAIPVDIDQPLGESLPESAIVTAEREHWAPTATAATLFGHTGFAGRQAFNELPDRLTQKRRLDGLGLATAKWREVDDAVTAEQLHADLGERVLLKRRTGGYDGKGQFWLSAQDGHAIPADWRRAAIAEEAVAFEEEASMIGVRGRDGQSHFYPLTLNLHRDGILKASVAPVKTFAGLQKQAESMLGTLMDALDYVGVMAMECFVVGERLIINEIAPRVHNSGHWTQAGASISQFENHLRAITDLPLAEPLVKNASVMINLIGTERDDRWLTVPGAELYWYCKAVKPARKVGHINLSLDSPERFQQALARLRPLLPAYYGSVIDWVLGHLPVR